MKNYMKGNVDETMLLGTLAANAIVITNFVENAAQRVMLSSIIATWVLNGLTASQGPILFGVAHSDYTDAEIEQVIEATNSWDKGDLVAREIAKRQVRVIGTMAPEVDAQVVDVRFNDGKPVKTKLNWNLEVGATLQMWAYNISPAALATTNPELTCNGHANLWLL